MWFGIEIPISGTLPSAIFIVLGSCALGKCDNHSAGMHGVWGNRASMIRMASICWQDSEQLNATSFREGLVGRGWC